jgi:hypothetical protein
MIAMTMTLTGFLLFKIKKKLAVNIYFFFETIITKQLIFLINLLLMIVHTNMTFTIVCRANWTC